MPSKRFSRILTLEQIIELHSQMAVELDPQILLFLRRHPTRGSDAEQGKKEICHEATNLE